jgi:formylglycine-generating enzyme required for sulfatase activity
MRTFLLALTLISGFAYAETPETIYPKTRIIKPLEWYSRQASLWHEEVVRNSGNADAWLNYFVATRYSQGGKSELGAIALQSSNSIKGTFEDFVIQSLNSGYSKQSFEQMQKAYRMQPANPVTYIEMLQFYEYSQESDARKEFSEKLYRTGLVSPSLLNYCYNVLMTLEENAILFTDSDNTTVPIYMIQDVVGARKDVTVLNLDMLVMEDYRSVKLNSVGLELQDVSSASKQELCALLPAQNTERSFYYALTLAKDNILSIKDQLYVVGLASQLSSKRLDNISIIKNNLENRFLLDYLTVDFNGENEFSAGRVLNANYLVPMLLLLEHYKSAKDVAKAEVLEAQIVQIAEQSGKSMLVENFLNRKSAADVPFIPYKLETKSIEGKFKQVKDNVYAGESEVTNREYISFLKFLSENKLSTTYEVSRFQLDQYEEPALSFMKGYHADRMPTKKQKYFLNHPAVNVSYEGAIAYCEWLTEQYNRSAERKYKKVRFRLPKINEWQIAALGYKKVQSWNISENMIELRIPKNETEEICHKGCEKKIVPFNESQILYPWYGAYNYRNRVLNSKGCVLGNFKWDDSAKPCLAKIVSMDGFTLMAPVQSYFPNDIGLYDVVGNVAEMTSEKGKACGGSWNHPAEQSTILSVNEYNGANSEVGFRVFMEVIEL